MIRCPTCYYSLYNDIGAHYRIRTYSIHFNHVALPYEHYLLITKRSYKTFKTSIREAPRCSEWEVFSPVGVNSARGVYVTTIHRKKRVYTSTHSYTVVFRITLQTVRLECQSPEFYLQLTKELSMTILSDHRYSAYSLNTSRLTKSFWCSL